MSEVSYSSRSSVEDDDRHHEQSSTVAKNPTKSHASSFPTKSRITKWNGIPPVRSNTCQSSSSTRPLPLPLAAIQASIDDGYIPTSTSSVQSTSVLSNSMAPLDARQAVLFKKKRASYKSVSSVTSSSSTTVSSYCPPPAKPVATPYESDYNAEHDEPLFHLLDDALSKPNCQIHELYCAVRKTALLYCQTWLDDGRIGDKEIGSSPDAKSLVLCLQTSLFHKAEVAVLKSISKSLCLTSMVKDFVVKIKGTNKYPKIAVKTSQLLFPSKDVLKSILFISRVYCAHNFLCLPYNESINGSFKDKVAKCLGIIEERADLTLRKPRGGKKQKMQEVESREAESGPAFDSSHLTLGGQNENSNPGPSQTKTRQVSADCPDLIVSLLDGLEEHSDLTLCKTWGRKKKQTQEVESREGENGPAHDSSHRTLGGQNENSNPGPPCTKKKRRVSSDSPDPIVSILDGPDLTSGAIMGRLKQLEEYFQQGLQEVHQLKVDFQRKEDMYKLALDNKVWGNEPLDVDEGGEDSVLEEPALQGEEMKVVFARNSLGTRKRRVIEDDDGTSEEGEPATPTPVQPEPLVSDQAGKEPSKSGRKRMPNNTVQEAVRAKQKKQCETHSAEPDFEDPSCSELVDETVAKSMREIIRAEVFRQAKFIKNEKQLHKVMKFVAERLGMPMEPFSKIYRSSIITTFSSARTSAQGAMKRAVHKYMDRHGGSLIEVQDLLKLRRSQAESELKAFAWFWDVLLPCVSHKSIWTPHKSKVIISGKINLGRGEFNVISVSDEAFALFLFENCRSKWMSEWSNTNRGTNLSCAPLYTVQNRIASDPFRSWNEAGTMRWKELEEHVKKDRSKEGAQKAEYEMLACIKNMHPQRPWW